METFLKYCVYYAQLSRPIRLSRLAVTNTHGS